MNTIKALFKSRVIEITLVVLVHWFLLHWLAKNGVVAQLFAAGAHAPKLLVISAIIFILLRLVVLIILPGCLTWYLSVKLLDWWRR
jgi:hypothetical protein